MAKNAWCHLYYLICHLSLRDSQRNFCMPLKWSTRSKINPSIISDEENSCSQRWSTWIVWKNQVFWDGETVFDSFNKFVAAITASINSFAAIDNRVQWHAWAAWNLFEYGRVFVIAEACPSQNSLGLHRLYCARNSEVQTINHKCVSVSLSPALCDIMFRSPKSPLSPLPSRQGTTAYDTDNQKAGLLESFQIGQTGTFFSF